MGSCASLAAAVDRAGVTPVEIIVSSAEATSHPRLDAQTQTPSSCWPVYDYHPALLYNAALLYPRRYATAARWTTACDSDEQSPPLYDPGRRVMSPTPQRVIGRASLEHLSKSAESPSVLDAGGLSNSSLSCVAQ